MNDKQYILDNDWLKARKRLDELEYLEDTSTIENLEKIEIKEGWRCLEVGAGGGSISKWLSKKIGKTGNLVAIDINTRFLNEIKFSNVEIRENNIVTDPLEENFFNFVYMRNILIHIPENKLVLRKIAKSLKVDGILLVEEPDFVAEHIDQTLPDDIKALHKKVLQEFFKAIKKHNADFFLGANLHALVKSTGLSIITAEGKAQVIQGGTRESNMFKITFEQTKKIILEENKVSESEFNDFLKLYDNPDFAWRSAIRMSIHAIKK